MTAAASCDRNIPAAECLFDHIRPHLTQAHAVEPDSADFAHGYDAICPAHDDGRRSLRVAIGYSRVYLKCFANCDELAIRAGLIQNGVPEHCLPITQQRKAELADRLTGVTRDPDMEYGHKVLLIAAMLQGRRDLPRGNELVQLAAEVGVSRPSAFRYKRAEGGLQPTSRSYDPKTKPVKPRRSPQQIVPQQRSHGETKSHGDTSEGLTVRPPRNKRSRRPAA
ncbi:MAG TPA: hypothetical protein VJY33_26650 [Isosphaeraceae bacterium]|nr:hypothetical protein [Isosphaeraceae bacterium]